MTSLGDLLWLWGLAVVLGFAFRGPPIFSERGDAEHTPPS